jgi:hypothetical protein
MQIRSSHATYHLQAAALTRGEDAAVGMLNAKVKLQTREQTNGNNSGISYCAVGLGPVQHVHWQNKNLIS